MTGTQVGRAPEGPGLQAFGADAVFRGLRITQPDSAIIDALEDYSSAAQPKEECNAFAANQWRPVRRPRAPQPVGMGRRARTKRPTTGLFTAVCGHLHVHLQYNMFTGERWAYSFFALRFLLARAIINVWLYDINCRTKTAAAEIVEELQEELGRQILITFCNPPFHTKMHNSTCQATNGALFFPGVGLLSGEPCEIYNAELKL